MKGWFHANPLFAQNGMLQVGDLYRQQLRVHAWRFHNGLLPSGQAAMLRRTGDLHGYATRSARTVEMGVNHDWYGSDGK